jgi:transcriptional regulator with XRE-family HTH domain
MAGTTEKAPRPARDIAFGKRVQERRTAAGLTQEGLAHQLGVSVFTVSRWEQGRSKPDIDGLYALASALGVKAADLLPGEAAA